MDRQFIKSVMISALLHDIGKLIQRADDTQSGHSTLGAEFLAKNTTGYPAEVLDCLRYHHQSVLQEGKIANNHPAYIIYEANNIAAGWEYRESGDEAEDKSLRLPLTAVFDQLSPRSKIQGVYRLQDFKETEQQPNYPCTERVGPAEAGQYEKLVDKLKEYLQSKSYDQQEPEFIQEVLEIVASYVPSGTGIEEAGDISLYDHSKMTAAVASCIAAYAMEKGWTDYREKLFKAEASGFRKEEAFLLVSGDVSGIQGFIYTIAFKGALKSLRARSFYLEMLVENFSDDLLSACNLNRINLLFSGGGHFYALLPNTPVVKEKLQTTQEKVNEWFLQRFSTAIYMGLAWQPCSACELMNSVDSQERRGDLTGEVFRKVATLLYEGKLRRYSDAQLERILNPEDKLFEHQKGSRECAVCHTSRPELKVWEDNTYICMDCQNLIKLGGQLTAGKIAGIMSDQDSFPVLIVTRNNDGMELPSDQDIPRTLKLISSEEAAGLPEKGIDIQRMYAIEKLASGFESASNIWLGNYCPDPAEEEVNNVEFTDLAAASRGIKRLGVLRADVDNLGSIFTHGFEQPESGDPYRFASISRYAALSRQLSLFFRHHINYIAKQGMGDGTQPFALDEVYGPARRHEKSGRQRQLTIVYAGGDDVFVVGAWDHVVEFAVDLRQAFRRFSGNKLTFSAGIGFFTDHTPITFMARAVGELEEMAKRLPGKDGIALFGNTEQKQTSDPALEDHIYTWDVFIDEVCNEKLASLLRWFDWDGEADQLSPEKLPGGDSLAHRLLFLLRGCGLKGGKINIARLAYLLGRLESGIRKEDKTRRQTYQTMRVSLWDWINQAEDRHQLLTALNLLIYLKRKEQKKEERE
jgi:CRISPR-associated protein Csm1